ncbi:hypothetical protein K458DRAFT_383788 [Lentithecium fluviatile CBS 122367]|uniref:Uncharacterized protein n=1 Tax=Lentithecium fluviatile CBS 122367 TaxID=1168545 RepID=A0A6G1JF76_9PLEO|nr:hypothetical protein K458DRAFT_383788 [Lentithecium fluviatile CBS 122367]
MTGISGKICRVSVPPDVVDIKPCCKNGAEVRVQDNCIQYCETDETDFLNCVVEQFENRPISFGSACQEALDKDPSSSASSTTAGAASTPTTSPTKSQSAAQTESFGASNESPSASLSPSSSTTESGAGTKKTGNSPGDDGSLILFLLRAEKLHKQQSSSRLPPSSARSGLSLTKASLKPLAQYSDHAYYGTRSPAPFQAAAVLCPGGKCLSSRSPAFVPRPFVHPGPVARPPPLAPVREPAAPGGDDRLVPGHCKRASCGPGGNTPPPHDAPGLAPAHPNPDPAGENAIPARVDRPANGQDIHNNLRGVISRNEPEVVKPPYTQSYKRDMVRANEPIIEFPLSDSRVKDIWEQRDFRVRSERWKPAVMDTEDFNFAYSPPEPRPDPPIPGSNSNSDSEPESLSGSLGPGDYLYGLPMVENYHDMRGGSITAKSQLKPKADQAAMPFSEKSYQMAKEDFRTNNSKWVGFMLTDHHNSMNNEDIVSVAVARENVPDGTRKGYMFLQLGAP